MTRGQSFVVVAFVMGGAAALATAAAPAAVAQDPAVQQKLAAVKQAAAANKQALAQYSWQELQTISVKGEAKKQATYSVRLGPDGKPQKTEIDSQPSAAPSGGPIKKHVVDKKEGEYEAYGKQIAALAQSYMQPDPGRLQQLYQEGQVTLAPGTSQLVIHNYVKQGDSVTMVYDPAAKALKSIHVGSYLDKPSDAVTISATFDQIPNGPSHVSAMTIDGVSKQLTVQTQNSNYQKVGSSSS
jgi:hypothetical protein